MFIDNITNNKKMRKSYWREKNDKIFPFNATQETVIQNISQFSLIKILN